MSWIDDASKILPLGELYKDLIQPSAQEIGSGLQSIVKTARFILAPFEFLGAQHDRYLNFLKKVSDKVGDQEQIEVHPQITGNVFEGIKYLEDNSILFEMFAELLAKATIKTQAAKAHPAFVHIINQLSPDEAYILKMLKHKEFDYFERAEYDAMKNRFYGFEVVRNEFPIEQLVFPDNYTMYINHLANLQIAGVPEFANQDQIIENGKHVANKIYRKLRFLDFGKLFAECCIPE